MASLNKVMLIGNLGKDPEVRYTAGGTAVASFSLATSEKFKGKTGEWEEKTEWHNITLWARLAEIARNGDRHKIAAPHASSSSPRSTKAASRKSSISASATSA